MLPSLPALERARPLLGTIVSIRVHGLEEERAHRLIDEAFGEIARVHALMSFQEPDSDISRLNRLAYGSAQAVHPFTYEVLQSAQSIAEASHGCFDITVADRLVEWGHLPEPASEHRPDPEATWRDIELNEGASVRFRRPLWIDVSGIAKGYAVDRAIATLQRHDAVQASVNAGGDLRIFGPLTERVVLNMHRDAPEGVAVLDLQNAAIASSGGTLEGQNYDDTMRGPHVDPRNKDAIAANRFVSVVADSCLIADALTKPVMIMGDASLALLQHFGASAHFNDPQNGWRHLLGGSA